MKKEMFEKKKVNSMIKMLKNRINFLSKKNFEREIKDLNNKLEFSRREAEAYKNKYTNLETDYNRIEKRAEIDKQESATNAITKFSKDLLSSIENFYRGVSSVKEEEIQDKSFYDGIKMSLKEMEKVLEKNGIVRIYPLNEELDPNFHQAIQNIESDVEAGKIANVIEAGYTLNGKCFKTALVAVSKK
ncbi:MAG: hypothetical protein Ta2D_10640 [Rickettsiales bacterium]|nr:MAG: hypothetical protein Ta2D_10640 [Rickettsiales bacterium]